MLNMVKLLKDDPAVHLDTSELISSKKLVATCQNVFKISKTGQKLAKNALSRDLKLKSCPINFCEDSFSVI